MACQKAFTHLKYFIIAHKAFSWYKYRSINRATCFEIKCKNDLIDVDFVESVVSEEGVEIVESFLAGDDAVILFDVGAPASVDSLLFDDVNFVRNLK